MLKFMVVLYKRPDMSSENFRSYLREVHGPLAKNLPGLRRYVQNFVHADPKRTPPDWDAVVELYFDNWAEMEAAWTSEEGATSDADLPAFADLNRTTWSVVDEAVTVLP
jgi:uncharacterized protein (TIGR02118 family)